MGPRPQPVSQSIDPNLIIPQGYTTTDPDALSHPESQSFVDALKRLGITRTPYAWHEHPQYSDEQGMSTQDQEMLQAEGLIEFPTMDVDVPSGARTFEFDGRTYLLPTKIGNQTYSKEEAIQRFLNSREHLGSFDNEQNAQAFYKEFLDYSSE